MRVHQVRDLELRGLIGGLLNNLLTQPIRVCILAVKGGRRVARVSSESSVAWEMESRAKGSRGNWI